MSPISKQGDPDLCPGPVSTSGWGVSGRKALATRFTVRSLCVGRERKGITWALKIEASEDGQGAVQGVVYLRRSGSGRLTLQSSLRALDHGLAGLPAEDLGAEGVF